MSSLPPATYDSASVQNLAIAELKETWRYRDLLRLLVTSSIKTRYKRSTLGVFWTLLNPLLNTLVLTLAFSQLFRFAIENFPVYLLCGFIYWNFFTFVTKEGMSKLVWGSNLLKRIYIPRTIFALSVLGNGLINLLLSVIPLLVIMLILQHPFRWSLLFLPYSLLVVALFTLGVTLFMSTLAVFFADVVEIYNVLLSALYFTIPLIYPLDILPERFQALVRLNPLYMMLEMIRMPIYFGTVPPFALVASATGVAVGMLLLGWVVFTKRVNELAYRI